MNHPQKDPVTYALAQIIDAELVAQGLSHSDLAKWTGMSQPTIWRKLKNGGDIAVGEANRMILALGLDFADTMRRAEEEAKNAGDVA